MSKEIKDISITELKALLFDIDQRIKQEQNNYQQVGMELQKKYEEEKKKNNKNNK